MYLWKSIVLQRWYPRNIGLLSFSKSRRPNLSQKVILSHHVPVPDLHRDGHLVAELLRIQLQLQGLPPVRETGLLNNLKDIGDSKAVSTFHSFTLILKWKRARRSPVWQQNKRTETRGRAHRGLRAVVFEDDSCEWIRGPRDVSWSQVSAEYNSTSQTNSPPKNRRKPAKKCSYYQSTKSKGSQEKKKRARKPNFFTRPHALRLRSHS